MIPRGARVLCLPLAFAIAVALTAHCASRVVDAVDMAPSADAGPPFTWPTGPTGSNSDPRLVAHHDSISVMKPRLLLLNYYNPMNVAQATQKAQERITAIADSSRYHGYKDASPAFLMYDLLPVVDLTDHHPPANRTLMSSTLLPTVENNPNDPNAHLDLSYLFTETFASTLGFHDPANPSRYLTLCQLFEQGNVNELWIMTGDESTNRRPPVLIESKQKYDAQSNAIAGAFEPCAGYVCWPMSVPRCGVTTRIAYLSPIANIGCDLVSHSVGIEHTVLQGVIPYLSDNARAFFNEDFTTRYGTSFTSWAALVQPARDACADAGNPTSPSCQWCNTQGSACIGYPNDNLAQGGYPPAPDGGAGGIWTIPSFRQGCGTAHFPPNAQFQWDWYQTQPVASRCEHYGMRDDPNHNDILDRYSSAKEAALAPLSGDDCAGGWQIYLRQNMPGLNNAAYAKDGTHMKNWWPFLFY
jgi:hypothetical protein